jgi:hypothetical protein
MDSFSFSDARRKIEKEWEIAQAEFLRAQQQLREAKEQYQSELKKLQEFERFASKWNGSTSAVAVVNDLFGRKQSAIATATQRNGTSQAVQPSPKPAGIRPAIREALAAYPAGAGVEEVFNFVTHRYSSLKVGRRNISWALHRMAHKNGELEIVEKGGGSQSAKYKLQPPEERIRIKEEIS